MQDAAFLRLGKGGRVAVFVEERLELRGGAAKGLRGMGGHGLEVVVGRAPGVVAGGVRFGGEGGGGNGGGVFQGVVEGVDRVLEGGDGGGQRGRGGGGHAQFFGAVFFGGWQVAGFGGDKFQESEVFFHPEAGDVERCNLFHIVLVFNRMQQCAAWTNVGFFFRTGQEYGEK